MTCSVAYALSLMSEGGFRHIPIVDEGGKPVAIISVRDIIDYIVRTMDKDLACLGSWGPRNSEHKEAKPLALEE